MSTDTAVAEPEASPTGPPKEEEARTGITFEVLATISMVVAFAAIVLAIFAVGLAARAIDESGSGPAGGGGGGGTASVAVSLDEFSFDPAPLSVAAGGVLTVTNDGAIPHDLTVEGQDLATAGLNGGESEELDLSSLAPGTYTVFCSISGHRESGMETSLTVG